MPGRERFNDTGKRHSLASKSVFSTATSSLGVPIAQSNLGYSHRHGAGRRGKYGVITVTFAAVLKGGDESNPGQISFDIVGRKGYLQKMLSRLLKRHTRGR